MAGEDIIRMSQRELQRLHVVRKVKEKHLTQASAAEILGLSDRQIRRIVKRVKEEGDTGIVHKSRGRASNRGFPKEVKNKVIKTYKGNYHDFGPTLASEKLSELDKIKISDETLRKWLIKEGLWEQRRKRKKHRQWRERKHHLGQMIQVDGSHHDWFEGKGPECVLMGYIDDATNRVYARFYEYEGTLPAMDSFKKYAKKYGLPHSVYIDKHPTYKSTAKQTIEDELKNQERLSQFERALKELGVDVIHANSPQAKGRIERLFGTFQDRVIKEMRLKGIKTIPGANNFLRYYLPVYNRRFNVEPKEKGDLHRRIPEDLDLDTVLCIKTKRGLKNDSTIAHNKKLYQVLEQADTKKITVEERISGRMLITYKDKSLRYKEITQRPVKKVVPTPKAVKPRKTYIPPKDHPWRIYKTKRCSQNNTYLQKEKIA